MSDDGESGSTASAIREGLGNIAWVIFLIAAAVLNPPREKHQEAAYEKVKSVVARGDPVARAIVDWAGDQFVGADKMPVDRTNLLVFSVGEVEDGFYTIGVLGQVIVLLDEKKLKRR